MKLTKEELIKEELIKELEKLEPLECIELIRDAMGRFYPGVKFVIQSYYIPEKGVEK